MNQVVGVHTRRHGAKARVLEARPDVSIGKTVDEEHVADAVGRE
jgi:hypothetical protein